MQNNHLSVASIGCGLAHRCRKDLRHAEAKKNKAKLAETIVMATGGGAVWGVLKVESRMEPWVPRHFMQLGAQGLFFSESSGLIFLQNCRIPGTA